MTCKTAHEKRPQGAEVIRWGEGRRINGHTQKLGMKLAAVALADMAQWIECGPANQRVAGSSPSQGTCLGCRPGPQ